MGSFTIQVDHNLDDCFFSKYFPGYHHGEHVPVGWHQGDSMTLDGSVRFDDIPIGPQHKVLIAKLHLYTVSWTTYPSGKSTFIQMIKLANTSTAEIDTPLTTAGASWTPPATSPPNTWFWTSNFAEAFNEVLQGTSFVAGNAVNVFLNGWTASNEKIFGFRSYEYSTAFCAKLYVKYAPKSGGAGYF